MEYEKEKGLPKKGARQDFYSDLPDVFQYQDYREFLKHWFEAKKKQRNNYSGAIFAKKGGFNSHTLLKMVIDKKRNLTYNTLLAFSKALGLKTKQRQYFEKLVLFNQAKSSEVKADFFHELCLLSKQSKYTVLDKIKNYQRYCSYWYVIAIHEMTALEDFRDDPEWIAKKLKNKITKKEAQKAWQTLLDLGFVVKKKGRFEAVDPVIDFSTGKADFVIQNFHKQYLKHTFSFIDKEGLAERELSSLTLAVSSEDKEKIREMVNEFRRYINLIYTKSRQKQKPRHLLAINMQILNLTTEVKEDDIKK